MLTKGVDIGFKDVDLKQGIVSGVFAKHNVKDLGGDISEFGVFSKSINERGPKSSKLIKFLLDHDKKNVPGILTDVWENHEEAGYEMKSGTHNDGVDFVKMVDSGIINQHSYGYVPIKEMFDSSRKANILKESMLLEVSAIRFLGMNPNTSKIELKDFTDPEEAIAYMGKLEKYLRVSTCTDDTLIKLENHVKSLQEILKPFKNTSKELEADQNRQLIEHLKNSLETWKTN